MQMVKRIIGGFFLLLLFLWLFAPKHELYYLFEKELQKNDIIISNEKINDLWFGLRITDADIYLKGIKVAKVDELNMYLFFLYNTLSIKGITTDEGIHNIAPKSIENMTATLSVLAPYKIAMDGQGSFGSISGGLYFNRDNKLLIRFANIKEIDAFKSFLKKDKEGLYYEKYYR